MREALIELLFVAYFAVLAVAAVLLALHGLNTWVLP